jgi:hypothetical protein
VMLCWISGAWWNSKEVGILVGCWMVLVNFIIQKIWTENFRCKISLVHYQSAVAVMSCCKCYLPCLSGGGSWVG